jgi:predicted DCC family thiol-disulfide oxidoreductase YuxK
MPDLTVLYDGSCSLCRGSVERVRPFDTRARIEFLDLHDPSVASRFPQVDPEAALRLMQAVDTDGRVWGGVEAWARIGRLLPGWKLIAWMLLVPGVRHLAARTYGWMARNRYRWNRAACADGTCAVHLPNKGSSKP